MGPVSHDAMCLSCSASNTDTSLFIPVRQHLSERRNQCRPNRGALKGCGSLRSVNADPWNFFGPLCWKMTEWERSHGDKREGGSESGRKRKQIKGEERQEFELILSQSLCDDCHRGSSGLRLNTTADNNRADG